MPQDTFNATGINGVALTLADPDVWYRIDTDWTRFAAYNKTTGTVHFRQTLPAVEATDDTAELPSLSTTPLAIPVGSRSFFLRADVAGVVKLTPVVS